MPRTPPELVRENKRREKEEKEEVVFHCWIHGEGITPFVVGSARFCDKCVAEVLKDTRRSACEVHMLRRKAARQKRK